MHNNSNMQNKHMEINTCKILPLFKISQTHAWKMTPFSWFREFAPPKGKNSPFLAKMGTSMVYVLVGSGGPALPLDMGIIPLLFYGDQLIISQHWFR